MRTVAPTLVIDLGTATAAAMVVSDQGGWLVPDPASGEARWRSGSDATALLVAMRAQAQSQVGPIDRAVVTIPASVRPGDPRRAELVDAAGAAGFSRVELLAEPAGALWAPGSRVQVGDTVLVYDLGATFEATVVRAGDDLPEILGFSSIVDFPEDAGPEDRIGLTVACCRDLLERLGLPPSHVRWVLPVGAGARTPDLETALVRGLGIAVAAVEEPELATVQGAAHWLPRSGSRTVMARPAAERMVPLVFTIPGGSARLVRWLVRPDEAYDAGAPLARVRLASGALWDLTARSRGTLDQVLVEGGASVSSGEWLALAYNG